MNSVYTGTIVDMVTFCSWLFYRLQQCSNLQIVTAYLFSIIVGSPPPSPLHVICISTHPVSTYMSLSTVSLQQVQLV